MSAVTTLVDELLAVLAGALGGAPTVSGRVVDPVGVPVEGATVRAVAPGAYGAVDLARAVTGADGAFALEFAGPLDAAYELVVEARGTGRRWAETRRPPLALGDVTLVLPLRLTGSVGDGGDNRPHDVRRVQDRLHRLGRLTDADVAGEPVALDGAPALPGPRTMAALAAQLASCFGRRLPVTRVLAAGPTFAALADDPPFPLTAIALPSPVGRLPGDADNIARNAPAAVITVQRRLNQLGFLSTPHLAAERVAGVVNPAALPHTMAAIQAFDRQVAGGSLQAIASEGLNGRLLNDPYHWGTRPLRMRGSVGEGGRNLPADVLAVQDRLCETGRLTEAQRQAEREAFADVPAEGRVGDDALSSTIAAIRELRAAALGEAAPAPGIVDPVDGALRCLNHPPRVELSGIVPRHPAAPESVPWSTAADVRRLQDRLLLLGFLTPEAHAAEGVDPYSAAPVDLARLAETLPALEAAARHGGPLFILQAVGEGAPNRPADVRLVQDRLHALHFLATADYERDRVDPDAPVADPARLVSLFAAVTGLRRRVFGLPAPQAGRAWTALPVIHPGDETSRFLADPLFYGRAPLRLAGSVGLHGWNFPADVRAVQERLREMSMLTDAEVAAEPLVDAGLPGRVDDTRLPSTLAAIARMRESLLGEAEGAGPARIETLGPAAAALDDRLGALRATLPLGASVGTGGQNAPADVRLVQQRLRGLGFLPEAAFRLESAAVPPEGAARLGDAQIPETIRALGDLQATLLGAERGRIVEPRSETYLALEWPRIPRRVALGLTASIGPTAGAATPNHRGDVRRVQDRLFEMELMDGVEYFARRVDASVAGAVADADMAPTTDAIRGLQATLAGVPRAAPDLTVSLGGRAQRVMEDPAYSTPTAPNAACDVAWAGPPPLVADAALLRCMRAIEAEEGGDAGGEIPALVRNSSWTPASWGAAQVTAATAINRLRQAGSAAYRTFYGLDAATLATLEARAVASVALFNLATDAVGANETEPQLRQRIAAHLAAHGAENLRTTGHGPEEVERMFRAGQLRRHVQVARDQNLPAARLLDRDTPILAAGGHDIQPHAAENIAALRMSENDVRTFINRPGIFEEHLQGFSTRSLFWTPQGQVLRNLLTDDSGFKIGRFLVRDAWQLTAGMNLQEEQRVRITAYIHNQGAGAGVANLVAQLGNPNSALMIHVYARRVVAAWANL